MANFLFCYIWEVIFLQGFVFNSVLPKIRSWRGPIHKFEKIEAQMESSDNWPPITTAHTYDSNETERIRTKPNKVNVRNEPNLWIMRSNSNDDELDSYYPSIIRNKSIDSPIETSHPLSFSTFVDGSHGSQRIDTNIDRDSNV